MRGKLIVLLIVSSLIVGCGSSESPTGGLVKDQYQEMMVKLSTEINNLNLPELDPNTINTLENMNNFVSSINKVSGLINANTEYKIPLIELSEDITGDLVKTVDFLVRFAPLVEPYNDLVNRSKLVNPEDSLSINQFSLSVGFFLFDVAVLQAKLTEKTIIYGGDYLWDYSKATGIIGKENLKTLIKYLGNESENFIITKVIPFLREQFKDYK